MDAHPATDPTQRLLSPALVIFGVALLARVLYLYQALASPYFGAPFLDERYYFEWAARISRGALLQNEAFFRAPLYAYLLGGLFALVGPNFFVPRLLQHLLGALAAVLVYKAADRCFGRTAGWIAGVMAALYPPVIFYEGEMLDISLQSFFYPALVLAGLQSLRDPRWRWTILVGQIAGAGAIARPNILLLTGAWLVVQLAFRAHWGGLKPALARAGATVGLLALWVLPLLVHNIAADGSWAPISTYAGVNFYIGNRLTADGYTASTPRRYESAGAYQDSVELFARRKAEEMRHEPLNGAATQAFWFQRAFAEIRANPARFAGLLLKKCVLFWNGFEIRNNKDLYFALQFTPLLEAVHRVWNFYVLAPLGLLGIALAVTRRRSPETLWLVLAVAAHMASIVVFFVTDRYRLPGAPLLIILAGGAAAMLAGWMRAREVRPLATALAGLAALAVATSVPWFDMAPAVPHKDMWNVANCHMRKGQFDEAQRWYEAFLERNPNFPDAWYGLGELHVRRKQVGPALACFEKAAQLEMRDRRERQWSAPWASIGYCRLQLGDAPGALQAYEQALARWPENRLARDGRAAALAALDRPDEALAELEILLAEDPCFLPALWTKATIFARQNRLPEARRFVERALALATPAAAAEIRNDPILAPVFRME